MALLNIRDLRIAFGGTPILDGVDLQIEAGERICLIGRNGAGKSTLMKAVAGDLPPDAGTIALQQKARCARLDQDVPPATSGSTAVVITTGLRPGDAEDENHAGRLVDTVVSRLGLEPQSEFSTLSGGLQRRVLLARALVRQPNLLLLDEPTNHLDLDVIAWLEDFLLRFAGALLFVSHDRALVRRLATRLVELERGKLTNYRCTYDIFLQRREEQLRQEETQQALQDRKMAQEEIWIRQGVRARRTRNEGRVRALLQMRQERQERRTQTGSALLQLQEAERSGKLVIEAKGLHFSYGDNPIVRNFSTLIARGDKIGFIGPNGTGKTTLLRLLIGELAPQQGSVRHGTHLQWVHFDQMRSQLDENRSVLENVSDSDHITIDGRRRHVIGYLGDFLFPPVQTRSPVHMLSGGERNRLLLARLFARPANLLIMDEPTNDLDIETLELLEELLVQYSGTLLLVSHDRAFLNNVVTSTLAFAGNGDIKEYVGGYDDYLRQRPQPAAKQENTKEKKAASPRQRRRKLTFKENRELENLPSRIEALEEEREALYVNMADPTFYQGDGPEIATARDRLAALEDELATAYRRWEELESVPS